jgi:hypothetical protein
MISEVPGQTSPFTGYYAGISGDTMPELGVRSGSNRE